MKIFKSTVNVPIEWGFCCDGETLRSSVVGGLQGEIHKKTLRIINRQGVEVYNRWLGTRKYAMKKCEYLMRDMLRAFP